MEGQKSCCACPCHKMMGIFVMLFGATFLVGGLGIVSQQVVNIVWPIIVILAGLKKMCPGMCKCCKAS